MTTRFLRDPYPERPSARPRRRLRWTVWTLALGAAGLFIYSGAAWILFRPAIHKPLINRYAAQYRFDPLWVMAVIRVESSFFPGARSHRGAVGLMQLLPSTARELAPEVGLIEFKDEDLRRPDVNLRIGVYYLSKLKRMFPDDDVAVLAAYNAGPGITQQWRQGKPALEVPDIPYPETRRFVARVEGTYGFLKFIQGWKHLFGGGRG